VFVLGKKFRLGFFEHKACGFIIIAQLVWVDY